MSNKIDWEQKAVSAIADKLGTGVDHFWPLFVREQIVGSVLGCLFGVLVLSISVFSFIKVKMAYKEYGSGTMKAMGHELLFACSLILGSACIFMNLGTMFNPEYHALKSVMEMMK